MSWMNEFFYLVGYTRAISISMSSFFFFLILIACVPAFAPYTLHSDMHHTPCIRICTIQWFDSSKILERAIHSIA